MRAAGLRELDAAQHDRRYVEGYRRTLESAAWAKAGARLLPRVLPQEKW